MVLDDAMEEMTTDEAELAVNGSQSTLDKGPAAGLVVRHLKVGVMQIGDGDYDVGQLTLCQELDADMNSPSQWCTQK